MCAHARSTEAVDNVPGGIWRSLAASLALDFLLISHVSHSDSNFLSYFLCFFFFQESHFHFYPTKSLKCQTTSKQTAEPPGERSRTLTGRERLSESRLKLSACYNLLCTALYLMRKKKITGRPVTACTVLPDIIYYTSVTREYFLLH